MLWLRIEFTEECSEQHHCIDHNTLCYTTKWWQVAFRNFPNIYFTDGGTLVSGHANVTVAKTAFNGK